MDWSSLFWWFILLTSFTPMLKQQLLEAQRRAVLVRMEKRRKTRVITLIHRQETLSFLGIPFSRYINIEDSEQILRAIRLTPSDMPIDLVLHTPGGLVLAAEQIARALTRHEAKVTVFVPHYAMSGGTLIALAADEIVMDPNAVLGPVDPQLGDTAAASILKVVEEKDVNKIDDRTLILADVARKAMKQVWETVVDITAAKGKSKEAAEMLATKLSTGLWTHDYPITVEEAKELGLNVSTEMPMEVYAMMNLYAQTGMGRPSVNYIPTPYSSPKNGGKGELR